MLKSAVLCHLSMRHEGHEKTKCGGKTGRALLPSRFGFSLIASDSILRLFGFRLSAVF